MFTSGARFVNAYMYQIFLQTPIDSVIFHLDFVEFQIHADHTQMLETRTNGTRTSHQTSSLPEVQLGQF